jgi:hypothetical protein
VFLWNEEALSAAEQAIQILQSKELSGWLANEDGHSLRSEVVCRFLDALQSDFQRNGSKERKERYIAAVKDWAAAEDVASNPDMKRHVEELAGFE